MKNKTLLLASLLLSIILCASQALAQLENTVSIQIDPYDWNQFTYKRMVTKQDSVLLHYWQRPNTGAQLFRANWIRSQKLNKGFSINFGPGFQVLKTKTDTDPQIFFTTEPVFKKGRLSLRNMTGYNISFRNPQVFKNTTKIGLQFNKKTQAGYQGEVLYNSKTGLRENYQGGTLNITLDKKIAFGFFGYTNLKESKSNFHLRFTASFNF